MHLRSLRYCTVLCCFSTTSALAGDPLNVLPGFVEDIFHVAQIDPIEINIARGYAGEVPPPTDKNLATNLYSEARLYDPDGSYSCSDFSFKSWNDWHLQGVRDGEIVAFGYWNTPVHLVWRRGRDSIEGVLAVPTELRIYRIIGDGKITARVKDRLLNMRGGYQARMLDWIETKEITYTSLANCDDFMVYYVEVQ